MKIRWLVLALISLALATTWGCKPLISPGKAVRTPTGLEKQAQVQPAPTVNLEVYFPLTVGSEWTYQGEGNEYASFTRKVLFHEGSRAQFRDDNGGSIRDNVVEFTKEGLVRIYNVVSPGPEENLLGTQRKEETFLIVSPVKVGTKWQVPEGNREIVDDNATVTTPAGTFKKCLHIQVNSKDSVVNEYYCPGVGLVKQDFQYGDQAVTSLLSRYSVK